MMGSSSSSSSGAADGVEAGGGSGGAAVVLGSLAFLVLWSTATFPRAPFLPVGRTSGALLASSLTVSFQLLTPSQAYRSLDLSILGLLFGTMLVTVYLDRAHLFTYLSLALSWRSRGPRDLLSRLSFLVALSSALFTNDTCCVFFTGFVLGLCRQRRLNPEPFLLALATSANIGSSAIPIGNPQNLIIAVRGNIAFGRFLASMLPAMLVGVALNTALLLAIYWKHLQVDDEYSSASREPACKETITGPLPESNTEFKAVHASHIVVNNDGDDGRAVELGAMGALRFDSMHKPNHVVDAKDEHVVTHSVHTAAASDVAVDLDSSIQHKPDNATASNDDLNLSRPSRDLRLPVPGVHQEWRTTVTKWSRLLQKPGAYVVTVGMLVAFLCGLDISWCAITAAITLVVLDFRDGTECLNKVSYSLLVFFSGMFITVEGFNRTGLPAKFWNAVEPHAHIDSPSGVAVLAAVIMLLSNIASNVPTVLLLGPKVAAAAAAAASPGGSSRAWLYVAWSSTIAGNLSLVGSAANLIVCEQAKGMSVGERKLHFNLSFWKHLKFGFVSTLIVVAIGLPLIRA